jgi:broad specificity phosphatase PhoE
VPLTAYGESQARALQPELATRSFALVLVSPLQRAWRTAELAGLTGLQAEPDLQEWNYGACDGLTREQIRARYDADWDVWRSGPVGGETVQEVGARADRVLARLHEVFAGAGADGDVAVVAHGHLLRVLGARWVGLPPQAGSGLALGTAATCVLAIENGNPVIWRWNVASPLPPADG